MLRKVSIGSLGREMTCNLNLISIQRGVRESKASLNKYYKSLIKDTIKSLRANHSCFLFNQEQIQAVKRITKRERIVCVVEKVEEGIWRVKRI